MKAKKTKNHMYIIDNESIYMDGNLIDVAKLEAEQQAAIEYQYGWVELGECETIAQATSKFRNLMQEYRDARKIEVEEYLRKKELERDEAWEKLSKLDVIPATVENIKIVLTHLNEQNWGAWDLPRLSIGYSAHQYDCDGKIASTIKLVS